MARHAHFGWLVAGSALTVGGCASSQVLLDSEVAKTNTQTVLAFEEMVYNKHRVAEAFDHYVAVNYVQHGALLQNRDQAFRALTALLSGQFAASRQSVKRVAAQGDLVAVDKFWDQQPGQSRGAAVAEFYRVQEGRIVERWEVLQAVPESSSLF